jgi:hypothetical protein
MSIFNRKLVKFFLLVIQVFFVMGIVIVERDHLIDFHQDILLDTGFRIFINGQL